MAWTTPRTWVPGETVTASMMNAHVRDNLNAIYEGFCERLTTDTTTVGNVTTGEDDLVTYSVPASKLDTNGQMLRVTCFGTFAANANSKIIKAHFGSTSIEVWNGTTNGQDWMVYFHVVRTGATTQYLFGSGEQNQSAGDTSLNVASPTETLSGAVTLKLTGTATATDDIEQYGMIVEKLH